MRRKPTSKVREAKGASQSGELHAEQLSKVNGGDFSFGIEEPMPVGSIDTPRTSTTRK